MTYVNIDGKRSIYKAGVYKSYVVSLEPENYNKQERKRYSYQLQVSIL